MGMASLAQHLNEVGLKQADFAAALGISQGLVSKLARGLVTPSLDLAFRIEWETGGKVPASQWVTPSPVEGHDSGEDAA